jgi:hypothetical protein
MKPWNSAGPRFVGLTVVTLLVGLVGVGLVSGTVFGTLALNDEEAYKKTPTTEKRDAGRRDATIADVSFGVAVAAAVVGAVILFTSDGEAEVTSSASRISKILSAEAIPFCML